MGRIRIDDLPKDMEINKREMRKIVGGTTRFQTLLHTGMIRYYDFSYPWMQTESSG